MILAEQLLAVLEQKQLLPAPLLQGLRKQLAQSEGKVPAATLAKRLVEKGHLTAPQAKQLLDALAAKAAAAEAGPKPGPGAPSGQPALRKPDDKGHGSAQNKPKALADRGEVAKIEAPADDDDLYGFADEPAEPAAPATPAPGPAATTPTGPAAAGSKASSPAGAKRTAPQSAPQAAASPGLDALKAAAAMDSAATARTTARPGKKPAVKKKAASPRPIQRGKSSAKRTNLIVALVGAALVIGIALYLLNRPDGSAELSAADSAFQSASYGSAVEKYTTFLNGFPRHEEAGRARVRLGICQLHEATAGQPHWPEALQTARQALSEMSTQFEFPQSQDELGAMLPQIAGGLVAALAAKPDAQLLDQATQAWDLVRRYVPKKLRNPVQAAEIEATLALVRRQLAMPADLEKAVGAMQQAVAGAKPADAYAARTALLTEHPELADQSSLRKVLGEVSAAEKGLVRWTAEPKPAEKAEPAGPFVATVALFRAEVAGRADGVAGHVIPAAAQGVVYALDASTGQLLWRRWVGFEPSAGSPGFVPLPVSAEPGADWILIDWTAPAVLRVEARSGKLRWRFPLEDRPCHPALAGNRLVVPTVSGRVVMLDADSGQSTGFVQLPQTLTAGPAVAGNLIFQPARQNSLFVLTPEGQCPQVVSLGYEPCSVTAAPAVAGQALLVAVNDGLEHATVEILSIGTDAKAPLRPTQQVAVSGRVDALTASGSTAIVASDLGHVRVIDLADTSSGKAPVTLAEVAASGPAGLIRFGCLGQGHWWLAGSRLTRYATAGMNPTQDERVTDSGSVFLQAPRLIGNTLFHVRQPDRAAGVWVSAVDAAQGKRLWETVVGSPLVSLRYDGQAKRLTAIGADGGVWRVGADAWKADPCVEPVATVAQGALRDPLTAALTWPGHGYVCATRDQLFLVDDGDKPAVKTIRLGDELAGVSTPMGDGLLVPLRSGQVLLLDAQGAKKAEAFQAALVPEQSWSWRISSPIDGQVLLSDSRSKLYLLGLKPTPRPQLFAAAQADLESALVSPLAVAGQVGYAVEASGQLRAFPLPTLLHGKTWPLTGRCVWGPGVVGDRVFVNAGGKLLCLDGKQNLVWQIDLPDGPLAGAPAAVQDKYLLASVSGTVRLVEAAGGKSVAQFKLGRPLGAGPLPAGAEMVLTGHDGSLHEFKAETPK